jgi:hypothetical protein
VKPSRITKARLRIVAAGSLTAVLLSLAVVYGASPANAADGRPTRAQAGRVDRTAMPMSPRGVIERRQLIMERRVASQPAGGTTVVLRGSRSPATPNPNQPGSNLNGAGYGSSFVPPGPVLQPGAGWDRELDYGGLDYGGSTPLVVTSP